MNESNNTAWLVPARLKAKALRSEADAAGELIRRLQNEYAEITASIARLEERKSVLVRSREVAQNITEAGARKAHVDQIERQLAPVVQELELLHTGIAELRTRQAAAKAAADAKIRPAYGAEQVLKHITGSASSLSIGGN
ncbi:MAG: hypothetical protein HGA71_15565 [Azonexaceae bacterium]|nr:hypothetical protein [Azonexaceae bacterium]